jgi:hypothetical protein
MNSSTKFEPMKKLTYIEPLEDRVAPATIVNPYTVTYQNFETNSSGQQILGDTVAVTFSKPLFANAATKISVAQNIFKFTDSTGTQFTDSFTGNTSAESLAQINLQTPTGGVLAAAQDINISVKIIAQAGVGNQQVTVGNINAATFGSTTLSVSGNIDLGAVYVQGHLGGITAGDNIATTPAIQSLTVESLGGLCQTAGQINKVNIAGDCTGFMNILGSQFGNIGQLVIGGSLTGDSSGDSTTGAIQVTGRIGSATIGNITGTSADNTGEILGPSGGIGSLVVKGSITGGGGNFSGAVFAATGNIGKVMVGGSIVGGAGQESGVVAASGGGMNSVFIGGSVTGSSGAQSGVISTTKNINSLQIVGSLMGNSGIQSGLVTVQGNLGKAVITGDIKGGSAGTAADSITNAAAIHGLSGVIDAASAGSIVVGGSIKGGTPGTTTVSSGDPTLNATADTSGAILVTTAKSITVMGSIIGGGGPSSGIITAQPVSAPSLVLLTDLGNITVNGDITGGSGAMSGSILATGAVGVIKSLHIGGNLTGGSASQSGEVASNTTFGPAFIGGSVIGGTADTTGALVASQALTSLKIGGSVTGMSGTHSGYVAVVQGLGSLIVGGSVTGGTADNTGEIIIGGALNSGTIMGNLAGDGATQISSTTAIVDTGYFQAGHIGTLNLAGNIASGTNAMGPIANSGAIRSTTDIGSLTIGSVTGVAGNPVIVSAERSPSTAANLTSDLAIGSVTVTGAATYLDVLAGYSAVVSTSGGPAANPLGTPINGAAQIGTLTFDSTLSASNLVAGATPDSNGQFGTTGTKAILPRTGAFGVLSSIANIIVSGSATGDTTPGDSFGLVAESLGTIKFNNGSMSPTTVPTANLIPGVPVAVAAGSNLFVLEPLQA